MEDICARLLADGWQEIPVNDPVWRHFSKRLIWVPDYPDYWHREGLTVHLDIGNTKRLTSMSMSVSGPLDNTWIDLQQSLLPNDSDFILGLIGRLFKGLEFYAQSRPVPLRGDLSDGREKASEEKPSPPRKEPTLSTLLKTPRITRLEWVEPRPACLSDGATTDAHVTLRASVHDCIRMQRLASKKNGLMYTRVTKDLLAEFMAVHWAWAVPGTYEE